MGRKRKGRDVHGWVIVDKPAGITSTSVVNKVRWAFDAKKAGHAGTLDPSATGLLAVALGEATKTVPYIMDALKCYEFEVRWGQATNTDDTEGEVIKSSDLRPTDDAIKQEIQSFVGDIQQVPPKFSAVKIDGQRAYKLARDGEDVELAARDLYVDELLLSDRPNDDTAILEMTCGKGGYVRSIARDLGENLGCLGHVITLRRLWSGPFDLDQSVTLDQIEPFAKTEEIDQFLVPLEDGLKDVPTGSTNAEGAAKLRNGNAAICFTTAEYGDEIWVSHEGRALAMGVFKGGMIHPSRVLVRE